MKYSIRQVSRDDLYTLNMIDMGYTSEETYKVSTQWQGDSITYILEPAQLERPFSIAYDWDWAEAPGFPERLEEGMVWGAFTCSGGIWEGGSEAVGRHAGCGAFSGISGDTSGCLGLVELSYANEGNAVNIVSLYVHRPVRGLGVGRALVNAAARWAAGEGARALLVTTQTGNMPAIRFYQKLGFRICGVHERLYANDGSENGESAIFLALDLGNGEE